MLFFRKLKKAFTGLPHSEYILRAGVRQGFSERGRDRDAREETDTGTPRKGLDIEILHREREKRRRSV